MSNIIKLFTRAVDKVIPVVPTVVPTIVPSVVTPPPTPPGITGTTWNSGDKASEINLSNGDLTVAQPSGLWKSIRAVAGKSSGKHYFEIICTDIPTARYTMIGLATSAPAMTSYFTSHADGHGYYALGGQAYTGNSPAAFGDSYDDGDIIGVAVDLDNDAIYFSKNGVWQASSDPESGASRTGVSNPKHYTDGVSTYYPALATYGTTNEITANFGSTAFTYTVPAGYTAGWEA